MFNIFLQTFLIVGIIVGLVKQKKEYLVLPFVAAVLSIMPVAIALCLQYCDVFYITLIGALIIVWKWKEIRAERMYFLFLLLGMCTSYFDFLTYPFVSLGIPLVFFLAVMEKRDFITRFLYTVVCSAAWCVGYLGMWAGKWILGAILLPESEAMSEAIRALTYRGSNQSTAGVVNVWDVLLKNLFVYLKWPTIIMFGALGMYLIYIIVKNKTLSGKRILENICYLLICLYPAAWYFISKNHSYEHTFMAYRELVILAFSGLCMLAETGQKET